jgi:hypothetical protein
LFCQLAVDFLANQSNFPLKAKALETAIAIDGFDLFFTTLNRKVVEILWGNAKHPRKGIDSYPAEIRPFVIDLALTGRMVKMNTPPIRAH